MCWKSSWCGTSHHCSFSGARLEKLWLKGSFWVLNPVSWDFVAIFVETLAVQGRKRIHSLQYLGLFQSHPMLVINIILFWALNAWKFCHPWTVGSFLFCVTHGFIEVCPNSIADKKLSLAAILWFYSDFFCCLNINMGRIVAVAVTVAAKNSLSRVEISFVKWAHLIRSSGHEGSWVLPLLEFASLWFPWNCNSLPL